VRWIKDVYIDVRCISYAAAVAAIDAVRQRPAANPVDDWPKPVRRPDCGQSVRLMVWRIRQSATFDGSDDATEDSSQSSAPDIAPLLSVRCSFIPFHFIESPEIHAAYINLVSFTAQICIHNWSWVGGLPYCPLATTRLVSENRMDVTSTSRSSYTVCWVCRCFLPPISLTPCRRYRSRWTPTVHMTPGFSSGHWTNVERRSIFDHVL